MSKKNLFQNDSEEEESINFKTKNEYAKNYDAWRGKEEIHKLEQKYGPKALASDASSTSDSEDESDESPEVSEEMEAKFLKTLALLKTKDQRIYDPKFKFFDDDGEKKEESKTKAKSLSFADTDDEDDEDDGGDIFNIEKKAEIEDANNIERTSKIITQETSIKDFLTGKKDHIDNEVEKDLAQLRDLWSDPKLNEGEAFLRDYILNKRYLDDDEEGAPGDKIRDDADLEADEAMVEEQGKFERAYNFRFEEPDEEYLKRFPRTMNYMRPKDDRRSRKRAEVRERKEQEKLKKMEEIARLKALKLKEIQEKIAKIKEVTGNDDLAFKDEDIEGDFDPDEHDKRMQALFDEQYYGDVDEKKPVFPDLDQELEIENWEKYDVDEDRKASQGNDDDGELHCEDEDFNMDADYDPKRVRPNLLEEMKRNLVGKKRRNRKKKSKLAQILAEEKPKFVPTATDKTYEEYMEEYYKMDCEDVIGGDLPTRFKYRQVVPNNYGLTIEEILLADDKELTQWVPLKKIVRQRPENVEKGDVKTYAQRAADLKLKKKVLPSLFNELSEEPQIVVPVGKKTKKKKKKNNNSILMDKRESSVTNAKPDKSGDTTENVEVTPTEQGRKKMKKHSDEANKIDPEITNLNNSEDIDSTNDKQNIEKKKKKKKLKQEDNDNTIQEPQQLNNDQISNREIQVKDSNKGSIQNLQGNNISKKKRKKNKNKNSNETTEESNLKRKFENSMDSNEIPLKKSKNKDSFVKNKSSILNSKKNFKNKNNNMKNNESNDPLNKLSDERLKAYGMNPKKYRGFLKYKKHASKR